MTNANELHQVKECQSKRVGYVEWHDQAERWQKQGKRQAFCAMCSRWRFPKERCRLFRAEGTAE